MGAISASTIARISEILSAETSPPSPRMSMLNSCLRYSRRVELTKYSPSASTAKSSFPFARFIATGTSTSGAKRVLLSSRETNFKKPNARYKILAPVSSSASRLRRTRRSAVSAVVFASAKARRMPFLSSSENSSAESADCVSKNASSTGEPPFKRRLPFSVSFSKRRSASAHCR